MKQKESIVIATRKKAITIGLIGSIIFIVIGLFMISKPDLIERYSEAFVQISGFIGISFFGVTSIYFTRKIFDNRPGLILNESGLINNSSIISGHSLKWEELQGAGLIKIGNEKILFIYIKDSKSFIKKFNLFEQFLMRLNLSLYGSPIGISTRSLNYDIDKLTRQIQYRIENWAQ